MGLLAIETADDATLDAMDGSGRANILISGSRAATLKLTNQRDAQPTQPVLIERAAWVNLAEAVAIADPALDLARPLKGPFTTAKLSSVEQAEAALRLARFAGILPALFVGRTLEAATHARSKGTRALPARAGGGAARRAR